MTSDFSHNPEDFAARQEDFSKTPENQGPSQGPNQGQDQATSQTQAQSQEQNPGQTQPFANSALPDDLKYAPKKSFAIFSGQGAELFGLMIVNFVFTILTLGIYHFWGKVKVRKYLWSRTNILGAPLEYTGNGLELFTSFLIVFVCLLVYSIVVEAVPLLAVLALPVLFWLIHFAMYRSIRFRLTRTRWRGIYANLDGSAASFANNVILLSIGNVLCLGLLTPCVTARLYRMVLNNIWWGDTKFSFNGTAAPLYNSFFVGVGVTFIAFIMLGIFGSGYFLYLFGSILHGGDVDVPGTILSCLLFYFGAILTIAIGFIYYAACKIRWIYDHLSLPGARFTCGLPLSAFMSLYVTNVLLLVFTLGFGYAWVVTRTINYLTAAAVYQGELDVESLQQNAQAIPKRGDGLLDALDLDVAF